MELVSRVPVVVEAAGAPGDAGAPPGVGGGPAGAEPGGPESFYQEDSFYSEINARARRFAE